MNNAPGDAGEIDTDLIDRCFTHPESVGYQALDAVNARLSVLYSVIMPTEESILCRYRVIKFLQDEVQQHCPGLHIIPYGSYITRVFLPDGDVDLAVVDGDAIPNDILNKMYTHLGRLAAASESSEFLITNLSKIQAEIPIVRLKVNNISVDISAARPTGLVSALYLQLLSDAIGRGDLLKRSLILIQTWCLYEAHILGSHSQMLNSYALRVMVMFILTNSPEVMHPLQVFLKFLAYYSMFDFDNNTITAFSSVPNAELDGCNPRALYIYLLRSDGVSQAYISRETLLFMLLARNMLNNAYPELAGCLRHFRASSEGSSLENGQGNQNGGQNGSSDSLTPEINTLLQYVDEALRQQQQVKKTADKGKDTTSSGLDALSEAVRSVIKCPVALLKVMPFSITATYRPTAVSIMDPIQPTNNLGRATSTASLARIRAAFKAGYIQLGSIMMMVCDKTAPLSAIQAEFDLLFANTLAHFEVYSEAVQVLSAPGYFAESTAGASAFHVSSGSLYHEVLNAMTLYLL